MLMNFSRLLLRYKSAAVAHGKSLAQYIQLHTSSEVSEFVSSGRIMFDNVERYSELRTSLDELIASSGATKFFVFVKGIDWEIFKRTLENFDWGLPLTSDGIIYGFIGLLFGMFLYFCIKIGIIALYKKMLRKKDKSVVMPTGDFPPMP